MEKVMFGAGCFWGVEAGFQSLDGVKEACSGYSGGMIENPSYEQVCSGTTQHTEVVLVEYDPEMVSFDRLLEAFWNGHDPTTLNRQGPDVGTQYRSAIYCYTDEQKEKAEASMKALDASGRFPNPVTTEITQAQTFYKAEDYHQKYFEKRGIESCHFIVN